MASQIQRERRLKSARCRRQLRLSLKSSLRSGRHARFGPPRHLAARFPYDSMLDVELWTLDVSGLCHLAFLPPTTQVSRSRILSDRSNFGATFSVSSFHIPRIKLAKWPVKSLESKAPRSSLQSSKHRAVTR